MQSSGGTRRMLALGDSYTIGEGVSERDRWPVQLAAMLRLDGVQVDDPKIVARTGWTTDELSAAMARESFQPPYDLVTLLIGVNNQYRGRSIEEYREQFAALVDRAIRLADKTPSRVVVLSIPDWGATPFATRSDRARIGAEIDRFNAVAREECDRARVWFVDVTPLSRRAATDVVADGLHPSGRMYGMWATESLPIARRALSAR